MDRWIGRRHLTQPFAIRRVAIDQYEVQLKAWIEQSRESDHALDLA